MNRSAGEHVIAAETELKLRFPPARLREVLASPLLRSAHGTVTRRLAATYFDTPALDLSQQRIALRVRREGRHWVQAVKGGGSEASGVHQRLEIEHVLRDRSPDVSLLPRHTVTRILRSRKVAESLVPVLQTEITRSLRLLEPAPGVCIEVAIDRGFIRSGRRREPVCEIELELKSGPVSALFSLAQQLARTVPLMLEHRSKAERGYDLFRGNTAPPVKAAAVVLTPQMTAGQAFLAIAAVALAQVHANEYGVIHQKDPEYLHQMRVGMRRLRSAFSLFRDMLGDAAGTPAALRALSGPLGLARDWDVFVGETLPMVRPVLTAHVAAEAFAAVCLRQQQRARNKLKKSLKTNTYNDFMITLGHWLAAPGHHCDSAAWRRPVRACATEILAAYHARVLKRGRHLERRTADELHRLRIAVKQLRYATEFFATLFSARGMAALRDRLACLQDILGRINDAAAVHPLLDNAADNREFTVAAGIVTGWCEARAATGRAELKVAWRRFRTVRRPWQD